MSFNIITDTLGSVSFNGTSQYLSIAANSGTFNFVTGDFTWECWVYPTSFATAGETIDFWSNISGSYIIGQCQLLVDTNRTVSFVYATTTSAFASVTSTATLSLNTWAHLAVVRSGSGTGNLKLYINGVAAATSGGAVTQNLGSTGAGSIGRQTSTSTLFYAGYISNVRIVKGLAVYTSNFSVPTSPLTGTQTVVGTGVATITNPASTVLLLQTPNTTSFISDSSAYAQAITNTGPATASSLTPFTQQTISSTPTGSLLFATSSAVRYTNSAFAVGTGNFTAECWVWVSPSAGSTAGFLASCSGTQSGFIIAKDVVGVFGSGGSGGAAINITGLVPTSTWTHMALVRNAGTLIIYINGVLAVTSVASSTSMGGTVTALASRYADDVAYNFIGYITNARFVAGVAVYTGNFTVPTAPLAITQSAGSNISAITGSQTSLLCSTPNNASYLVDSSNYNLTATVVGTVSSNALTPFVAQPTYFTSTTNPLGSVRFNGTSQSLTVPSNAAFAYGTGVNFTIEMWIYPTAISGSGSTYLFDGRPTSTSGFYPTLYVSQTTGNIVYFTNNAIRITSSSAVTINTWYHVALVRNSGTTTLYLNGIATGSTYADTNSYLASAQWIGATNFGSGGVSAFYSGYISNLRVVNGVAVYTGGFTPPTQPLAGTQAAGSSFINIAAVTASQTSLLLQTPNNTSFITDSSLNNFTVTNNGSATASSLTPFSTSNSSVWDGLTLGSASFNGTSQYVQCGAASNWTFTSDGTQNYTLECWFYTASTAYQSFAGTAGSSTNIGFEFSINGNGAGSIWVAYEKGTGPSTNSIVTTAAGAFSTNRWNHVAYTFNSSAKTAAIYVNGVSRTVTTLAGTTALSSFVFSTSTPTYTLAVGYGNPGAALMNGYISNFRIAQTIVYTGNFTPPIQPLAVTQPDGTNISAITGVQTSLLLNTPNNITIADSSTNSFAITNTGTVTTTSQTPFTTVTGPVAVSYTNPSLTQFGSWFFSNVNLGALNLTASTPQYSFGTGDFTIEFWMYMPGLVSSNQIMFSLFSNVSGSYITGQCEIYVSSGQGIGLTYATGLSTIAGVAGAPSTISTSTWYHVALVRIGSGANNVTLYLNGAVTGQGQVTQALGTTGAGRVGLSANGATSNYFSGVITNLRVVNGLGVYTGVFTPPTSPLTVTQPSGANIAAITIPSQTTLLGTAPRGTGREFNDFSVYRSVTSFNNTGNVTLSASTPFTSTG